MSKYLILPMLILVLLSSCNKDDDEQISTSSVNYKKEMRDFVIGISEYAKSSNSNFAIIPQNGIELVSTNGDESGVGHAAYLEAIDANGQEDLFYGYDNDDDATSSNDNSYLRAFLDMSKNAGNKILVTDYCSTLTNMDDSYSQNASSAYVSFAADHRELDNIPDYPISIHEENDLAISSINDVSNFLYLINPDNYATKQDFINAVTATNYDLIIMDLFFHDGLEFTSDEVSQLRSKANGGSRLVVSYMSIGEAEDYRYYWDSSWGTNSPSWMDGENPDWAGNYKVKYWNEDWQSVIYGNDQSYLKKILDANFDGVYLDIIDAFDYYE